MDLQVRETNRKWLDERLEEYPHRCQTPKANLGPATVERRLGKGVPFIRCPVGRVTEWGFTTEAHMTLFKKHWTTLDNRS